MISFICPRCKTKLQRSDAEAGTRALCPSCNQTLIVPTPPGLDKPVLGQLSTSTPVPTPSPVRPAASLPAAAPLPVAELYTPPSQPNTEQSSFSFNDSGPSRRSRYRPPQRDPGDRPLITFRGLAVAGSVVFLGLVFWGFVNAGLNAYRASSRSASELSSQPSIGVYGPSTKGKDRPIVFEQPSNPPAAWDDRPPPSRQPAICPDCKGSGLSAAVCSSCRGTGVSNSGTRACPVCNGRRFNNCLRCNGTGKVGYFNP